MTQPQTKINEIDQAEMVWVPPGPFLMGDDRRTVVVHHGYFIYKYPVTQEQYRRYCRASGAALPRVPEWGWRANHPVVDVSWEDAAAYCKWAGVDLPSDIEWEKAARGTDGRKYPWGDQWERDRCRCSRQKYGDAKYTSDVTAHAAGVSPCGAFDMSGNVYEWCADWYDETEKTDRVVRGGGWYFNVVQDFRCAARGRNQPHVHVGYTGFRCVFRPGSS